MSVRAVLFDLDGTLLDTLTDIATATNGALRTLGLPEHSIADYRRFVGSGIRALAQRALGEQATEERVASVIEQAGNGMAEHRYTRPYDGVRELLHALGDEYQLAILSNKPHAIVRSTVDRYFPDVAFREVEGQREGIPEKPDPAMARSILSRLGIAPSEVVYVGDSDIDMMTAANAHLFGVGAAWGFRGRLELEDAGADVVIDTPLALLEVLNERRRDT